MNLALIGIVSRVKVIKCQHQLELRWHHGIIRPQEYNPKGFFYGGKMAKLFIYFSISGNGDVVAEKLKNADYEIRKIETKKKFKNNFFGIFKGGFLAGLNKKVKLLNYNNDLSNYDENMEQ